ncbi:MAG: hypothetical protein HC906_01650 [Bacteroidales bacterium]|nr:hypothetical protein [Bacteroidales bacterium]
MGLTKSSHPTGGVQIIPPFSLLYIAMLHDYFMLQDDPGFVKKYIPGIRFILDWFVARIDSTGMLGPLTYWNHVDGGTKEFSAGSPPGIEEGGSAHMSFLLAYSLNKAIEMFEYFGYTCDADVYKQISTNLIQSAIRECYDEKRGLVAETAKKQMFSQHTNSMAILAGAFNTDMEKAIAKK